MGKKRQTQTAQTSTTINPTAKAAFERIGSEANRLYDNSSATPFSPQSIWAQNTAEHIGKQGYESLSGNMQRMERLAGEGGLSDFQRQSVGQLDPIAASEPGEGMDQLNDVQQQAYDYLNPIAGGSTLNGNPYLDEVIANSSRDMSHAVNEAAGAGGRYGSGAHQGVLARNIGDMTSGLRFADYGNQQQRQDAAIRDLFGVGNQANAQYEADMGRKMDAIGSIFNAGQQQRENKIADTNAIYNAYNQRLASVDPVAGVGAQLDLEPWNNLTRFSGGASGLSALGGTTQTYEAQPSALSKGLGLLPLGLGLGGQFGLFG